MQGEMSHKDFIGTVGQAAVAPALGDEWKWEPTEEADPAWWAIGRMRARIVRLEMARHGWGDMAIDDAGKVLAVLEQLSSPYDLGAIYLMAKCLVLYPGGNSDAKLVAKADAEFLEWLKELGYPSDMMTVWNAVMRIAEKRREEVAARAS
jgi:hypothetical protein